MRWLPALLVIAAVGCAFELPEPTSADEPTTEPEAGVGPKAEAGSEGSVETEAGVDPAVEAGLDGAPSSGIVLVQKVGGGFAKVETVTHQFLKPVTAGNAIIVFAYTQGTRDVTLTDTDGNAYQALHVGSFGLTGSARFFFAPIAKASTTPATITETIVDPTNVGFVALEYSGLLRTTDLETFAEDYGYVSTTSMQAETDPMKTTSARALVLAAFWYSRAEGTITPGVNFDVVASDPGYFFLLESRIVGPGSTVAHATMPMSYEWGSVFAAFPGR